MSTKSTIWYGTDATGRDCHLYWELAERIPHKAASIFMHLEAEGRETTIRLPIEIAQQVREVFEPNGAWEII